MKLSLKVDEGHVFGNSENYVPAQAPSSPLDYCSKIEIISKSFYQVSSEGVPRLLDITDYKKIIFTNVNKTLELKCPIDQSKMNTYVEWERENESLYMKPGYEITKRGTLKIKSVGMQHAGTYTCEAVNGYGFLQVRITVVIDKLEEKTLDDVSINSNSINRIYVSPPKIEESSVNFVDDVSDQATLHCVAKGQPLPHIFWFKNGVQIKNAETEFSKGKVHSTLKLRNLQIHDFGTYKCIARNVVSEVHKNFDLPVKDFPNPPQILSLEPTKTTIKEGEAAVFWCEIFIGNKPGLKLYIKWFKKLNKEKTNDLLVMDDAALFRFGANFYRPITLPNGISTNPGPDGFYKSKLLIRNTCVADSGTYICLALNDKGFNFKNVTLTVTSTAAHSKKNSPNQNCFSISDIFLIIIAIISSFLILGAIILVSQRYYRG
ncbi:fibroblast growth factor receptor-like 1 [Trichonephila inaurata madagascariensis]|uniref:Fibroblast growth factor receptor-like 1 n=1 Tax=Trichonephila inaurata madagascariensis TaxID=2747483 RepID=A0A8X6X3U6_9ARAC|nr:fibroblast growth factor receptor-like 1 [Trichonephila inaurata madagascariensis]